MYVGKLVPAGRTGTRISLSSSRLSCVSCQNLCNELMVVPKKEIGFEEPGEFRIVRCMDCLFLGPYYVVFENGLEKEIILPKKYEHCGFIEEQCDRNSIGSIQWIIDEKVDKNISPTVAGCTPIWLQADETPKCIECHKKMEFILQLSSESIDTYLRNKNMHENFNIEIEYYATLYFFRCASCNITCSITQST